MIVVTPGREYFWKNGVVPSYVANARYTILTDWIRTNVADEDWFTNGGLITTLSFYFQRPEDALAFKLKFGL